MKPESKVKVNKMYIAACRIVMDGLKEDSNSLRSILENVEYYFQRKVREWPQGKTLVQAAARQFEEGLSDFIKQQEAS